MMELYFEWDEAKDTLNQRKHGIAFAEAKTVFADELGRIIPDPDHSEKEERFLLLGASDMFRLLLVSHCERSPNLVRIISARRANKHERKQYEEFTHA